MKRAVFCLAAAFVLVISTGCDGATDPGTATPVSGVLLYTDAAGNPLPVAGQGEHGGLLHAVEAPDTVHAGEEFEVVVSTIGPSGCWSRGTLDVSVEVAKAVLRPYDLHSGAELCTLIFSRFTHRATVRFVAPGEGVIRVIGRQVAEDDLQRGTEITIEKRVTVL